MAEPHATPPADPSPRRRIGAVVAGAALLGFLVFDGAISGTPTSAGRTGRPGTSPSTAR